MTDGKHIPDDAQPAGWNAAQREKEISELRAEVEKQRQMLINREEFIAEQDLWREFSEWLAGVVPLAAAAQPPAAPVETQELLSHLVDWTYLHAVEGEAWPSTKTKQSLIALARQYKPTQYHADGLKAAAPQRSSAETGEVK